MSGLESGHVLNRPIWSALTTHHARFAVGDSNAAARRYDPEISPFACARDNRPESLADLQSLLETPEDSLFLLQADALSLPDSLRVLRGAPGVQMWRRRPADPPDPDGEIVVLGREHAPAMRRLALATEPGPFHSRTHEMGTFLGVFDEGRLIAMAGERFRLPGYTEVSGVCTDPEFRGRGLAARLSAHVAARIEAAGQCAFLHAYADNVGAIALYQKLGFSLRTDVNAAVVAVRTSQ